MNHLEGTFKGIRNTEFYYQAWLPDGSIKGVILIVHGLGEHSGRYTNYVNYFVPRGYAIYGYDHIGHGRSGGEREVIVRFEDFIEPLTAYYDMVKGWQPGKPIFIFGHSLGGLIASYYLLDHQSLFQGGIISSPLVTVPSYITPFTIIMGKVLSRLAPKMGLIPLDANQISRDPAVVNAYVNDPLVFHKKTPTRMSAEMLRAMTRVTAEVSKITLPLLIIQGEEDHLVEVHGSNLLKDKAQSQDKAIKIYPGLYHEVHNEPEREIVFKDVEAWLDNHL